VGGAVGALLVAGLGVDVALLANAATFGVGAVLLATARGLPRYEDDEERDPEHWRTRLAAAFSYLRRNRTVLVLLVGQGAALIFFSLTEPIEVPYTRDVLDAGAGGYGALIGAWGVGVMVGSVIHAWIGTRRLELTVLVSTLVLGGVFIGLGAAPNIGVACAVAVVGGAANGVQMVAIGTAIQEAIELDFQARVMSFYEAVATATPGIGYMLGGLLGATLGGRAAFMVAGAGIFGVVLAVLLARPGRAAFARAQAASARP